LLTVEYALSREQDLIGLYRFKSCPDYKNYKLLFYFKYSLYICGIKNNEEKIMENYKADYYNPETFEKSEIETKIPVDLLNEVKQTLDKMDGYMITPTMVNPDDNSVVFGIMDLSDTTLKYKISITPNYL
jgi:hypothetical protein